MACRTPWGMDYHFGGDCHRVVFPVFSVPKENIFKSLNNP
jgi:hypothetical protein